MAGAPPYVLGVDCGTQSLRSALFDLAGNPVAQAVEGFETTYPQVSWAEQNPEDWLRAMTHTVRDCLSQAGIRPEDVCGIGLDTTACTPVAVDDHGTPLRPALLWMDQRAHREAAVLSATGHPILRYAGGPVSPEWGIPKSLWLKANEPETYRRAARIVDCSEFLTFHLTGNWVASLNTLTCKWNYARPDGGYAGDLLESLGLADWRTKYVQDVRPVGDRAGELTPIAAERLGLNAGTPVAVGGIDAYMGMIGLNVVEPGRMALVMGSSTCHMCLCAHGVFGSNVWGPFPDALTLGAWVLEGGQTATGSIVKWFADGFCGTYAAEAKARGQSIYALLDAEAARVPIGSEGVVCVDYFQGNRTPLRDPLARGALWGLGLRHGPGHILRAIYEGTAFGTRHIVEDMAAAGFSPTEIYACGGGARSRLWLQIHADACGLPITLTEVQEAAALGSAILGAVAAGLFPSIPEAAAQMVRTTDRVEPNAANRAEYDFYFDKYVRTYPALKDLMHEVAGHVV
ncbi:MAG TPA: FGGY-family carbohydrate kinase [Armatimonadota bacterium]|nr:FGGY-family carbohydrate kinase [Armatimonadota bacterium]